jgi:hypothetical protein
MHVSLAQVSGKAQTTLTCREYPMSNDLPAHDFLLPRLAALIEEAVAAGIERDVAVAVLIDLVTSSRFDTAAPDSTADADPRPGWERKPDDPVLIAGQNPAAPPLGAQDEADFVKPFNWFRD